MANKRIGDIEGDAVLTVGLLGGLYFFIAKPLLNLLGDSPEDKNEVASLDTISPGQNPFSLQFSGYLQYLQSTWGTTDPSQDFALWRQVKTNYDNGLMENETLGSAVWLDRVAMGAEIIYSAFSFWSWSTDTSSVQTVFSIAPDQTYVSAMDAYLQANYQVDLLTLLKNGSTARIGILQTRNGLNDTQLAAIIRHIDTLPVYATI